MSYTTKEEFQAELKTLKEVYLTHLDNQDLKDKTADIIAWYEEEIARIERIEGYERNFTNNTADKKPLIVYP